MQTSLIIDEPAKKYYLISSLDHTIETHSYDSLTDLPVNSQTIVTVLVNADSCTLYHLTLPKLRKNELFDAARYALEDQLPADLDDLHFSFTKQTTSGELWVAVMDKALYENICQAYQAAQINIHYMLPYYLVIPYQPHCWSMIYHPKLCALRIGELAGCSIDTENLATILPMLLSQHAEPPQKVIVFNDKDQAVTLPSQLNIPIEFNQQAVINQETGQLLTQSPLNLLTKQHKTKHKQTRRKKPWRLAMIALTCWLALLFLGKGLALGYLHWQSYEINRVVTAAYHRIYPNKPLTNFATTKIKLDLKKLQISARANHIFSTLTTIGQSLNNVQLDTINYAKKELTIHVTASNNQQLTAFTQELTQRNLTIQQKKLTKLNNKIQAIVKIKDRM